MYKEIAENVLPKAPRQFQARPFAASILQNPGAWLNHRLLIVLLVSVPLWLYATTWDIVMMLFNAAADGHGAHLTDVIQLVLTRLLILPLLIAAYFLATQMSIGRRISGWLILGQIALACSFSLLTSPALAITYYLTNHSFAASHSLHDAFNLMGPWQIWLSKMVQYSIVYVLGLVLIFALNAFLKYKSESLKVEQLRSKWLEAKLETLRGQLNPHFLFNSLNAVVALINTEPERAEHLLTELGTLLRQSLHHGDNEFTSLSDELDFIERYLRLMKVRYGDRLTVKSEIQQDSTHCRIPSFLLVPLVENAIKHGVGQIPGGGSINIKTQIVDDCLRLSIRNCSPNQNPVNENAYANGGVGLKNTRQRLVAIYEDNFEFESRRETADTWLASLALPISANKVAHDKLGLA